MVKKELMYGDWVCSTSLMNNNNKGEMFFVPFRIFNIERWVCIDPDSIDFDPQGGCVKYESLLPIRITVETLLDNGFEVESSKDGLETLSVKAGKYSIKCCFKQRIISGVSIESDDYDFSFHSGNINFIHELQNLFTVNQIEFDFKSIRS